jgi:hypothetical protein
MGVMEDLFSNSSLNALDKVLVLDPTTTIKITEIKKLLRATRVRKLQNSYGDDLDSFICMLITRALYAQSRPSMPERNLYVVKGRSVSSALLALKVNIVATLELNADRIKKLHNACLTKEALDGMLYHIKLLQQSRKPVIEILEQRKKKTDLIAKSKRLDTIFVDYGVKEVQEEMLVINDVMKNRW